MTNSVDPDQTAPIGAVCSGSTLFATILKFIINVWQLFAADDISRQHFQMHFFLALEGLVLKASIMVAADDIFYTFLYLICLN